MGAGHRAAGLARVDEDVYEGWDPAVGDQVVGDDPHPPLQDVERAGDLAAVEPDHHRRGDIGVHPGAHVDPVVGHGARVHLTAHLERAAQRPRSDARARVAVGQVAGDVAFAEPDTVDGDLEAVRRAAGDRAHVHVEIGAGHPGHRHRSGIAQRQPRLRDGGEGAQEAVVPHRRHTRVRRGRQSGRPHGHRVRGRGEARIPLEIGEHREDGAEPVRQVGSVRLRSGERRLDHCRTGLVRHAHAPSRARICRRLSGGRPVSRRTSSDTSATSPALIAVYVDTHASTCHGGAPQRCRDS